jgi:hypothetical protein
VNRRFHSNHRFARALLLAAGWLALTKLSKITGVCALIGATPTRCTTYYESMLHRYHTLCADGTRAISMYNKTLGRWDTIITTTPRWDCTGQMNLRSRQVEVRCR